MKPKKGPIRLHQGLQDAQQLQAATSYESFYEYKIPVDRVPRKGFA